MRPFDVVGKGEEGVGAKGDAGHPVQPCPFFFFSEDGRLYSEDLLPRAVCQDIHVLLTCIDIDGIVAFRPSQSVQELKSQHLRRLAQEPVVGFTARQTGAVNPGLLSGTDADGLPVFYEADGIGLGVFQSDQGDLHVHKRFFGNLSLIRHHMGEQFFVDLQLIAPLLEGDAEHLFSLQRIRYIVRVNLDHIVVPFFLLPQQIQRFLRIAGSDDAVGHFSFDQSGGICVTDIGEGDEIAEGRHTVSAPCPCISACKRRQLSQIVHPVDLCQGIRERKPYGSACGGYVFEGCSGGEPGGFFQFPYQLPAVEGIEKIDIAGLSGKYLDRKVGSVFHIDAGRFLVGVASVF